jgi:hypothetical protein
MMDVEKLVIIFHAEPPGSPPLMCLRRCCVLVGVWKWLTLTGLFTKGHILIAITSLPVAIFLFIHFIRISVSRRRRSAAYKIIAALEVFTIWTFEDPMNLLLLKLS